jgi:hypothetical protein
MLHRDDVSRDAASLPPACRGATLLAAAASLRGGWIQSPACGPFWYRNTGIHFDLHHRFAAPVMRSPRDAQAVIDVRDVRRRDRDAVIAIDAAAPGAAKPA